MAAAYGQKSIKLFKKEEKAHECIKIASFCLILL
jgi:hypothetical protein